MAAPTEKPAETAGKASTPSESSIIKKDILGVFVAVESGKIEITHERPPAYNTLLPLAESEKEPACLKTMRSRGWALYCVVFPEPQQSDSSKDVEIKSQGGAALTIRGGFNFMKVNQFQVYQDEIGIGWVFPLPFKKAFPQSGSPATDSTASSVPQLHEALVVLLLAIT